jgi:hypothetical protein
LHALSLCFFLTHVWHSMLVAVFLAHACMALHHFFFRFPSNKTQVISISRVTRCNTQE